MAPRRNLQEALLVIMISIYLSSTVDRELAPRQNLLSALKGLHQCMYECFYMVRLANFIFLELSFIGVPSDRHNTHLWVVLRFLQLNLDQWLAGIWRSAQRSFQRFSQQCYQMISASSLHSHRMYLFHMLVQISLCFYYVCRFDLLTPSFSSLRYLLTTLRQTHPFIVY